MSWFTWLRDSVKNAVLGGFNDAIDELQRKPVAVFPDAGEGFRERLMLPAPETAGERRVRAKA